ncbi:hypothetical protein EVJ58_g2868 [Rhodofomes roseus]|uniref:Dihydrolipoamide acetyltransferase component of pyruvate dehydrogenase complex n=1 Tax=Rhodofomes roseus TaxID=34475 RepID=A0A4Y9YQM0_9APHY|nr:hypothetical protein EVJ58_g2868 [Rhodofomes roseus]
MFRLQLIRPRAFGLVARFHTGCILQRKALKEFKLADIGEGITECEVIRWSVKPASPIQAFDPLCEVQSDKATVEITSPFEGVVKDILVREGEVAKVGAGLCTIEVEEEDDSPADSPEEPPAPTHTSPAPEIPTILPGSLPMFSQRLPCVITHDKKGVDLALLVPGSGKSGRVEKQDVDDYLSPPAASASRSHQQETRTSEDEMAVELGRTRLNMWKAMTKSLEIPQFSFSTTLDITELNHILPVLNSHIPIHYRPSETASSMHSPVISPASFLLPPAAQTVPDSARYARLTYLPILLKTLSKAMHEWPLFRSSLTASPSASNKPTLTVRPHVDISVALSTPTGLYTPTLQAIDRATVYDIASRLKHLAHLGRQVPCALTLAEMPKRGGTITVSNIGGIGDVDSASPVLVPGGGVAIMAVGRAKWVWDVDRFEGGARRLKMGISWSADHRIVEGAELVAFMEAWRSWVETPARLIGNAV